MPRRGAVALVTTILAVVLLFCFKTSDQTTLGRGLPSGAIIGAPPAGTAAPAVVGGRATPSPTPASSSRVARSGATASPEQAGPPAPDVTPAPTPSTGGLGSASGTYTGQAIDTPYGTVQIALVVQGGKIVDVQELQLPNDRRLSQQISAEAGPMLRTQVLRAQSDNINGVSGASFTSYGFYQSLQSALAQMQ